MTIPAMPNYLELRGCRHDILGHYLKAIGLLRVLAKCADAEHRDPEAEGWWDIGRACFCLHSTKYHTREKLAEFFALHYRPTAVFAAWNRNPGCTAKDSQKFGLRQDWEMASRLSARVVSAQERKKPANRNKLTGNEAFVAYREAASSSVTEALDSIAVPFLGSDCEHPLFLSKGVAGRAHVWRTHWEYVGRFRKLTAAYAKAIKAVTTHRGAGEKLQKLRAEADKALQAICELIPFEEACGAPAKGKGTPFFPDAIKAYNIGSGWVTEDYPFNALDYVLAVEGAFAMRGSVARTLAANSRRFAVFPFVFDACEEMVDDRNEAKGTASALWLPLWDRPSTFAELSSFLTDAQARLPGKEARFSAEFMRALHSQGVDAGFVGWQEFRFKMKASRVPWVTTGSYVESDFREEATRLSRALNPIDESGFLDQFEIRWQGNKLASNSPHSVRAEINIAIETAMRETTPHNCLDVLCALFRACRRMAIPESFRKTLRGRPRFFRPLPMEDWSALLTGLEKQPEFRIARALASIVGRMKQPDGSFSEVQPMLGSLLPLKLSPTGWFLPEKADCSHQAVWTGTDLCHDLAGVLSRRYLDSLKDERPALISSFGAPLSDVLAFLNRELDDELIARWIEALSLVDWKLVEADTAPQIGQLDAPAIPPEYAVLRTLLELECENRDQIDSQKRRSRQPIALLCQRSASTVPRAVTEALRWISIWGVPNAYPNAAEKPRLAGRYIINPVGFSVTADPARLAAAVCIPLHRRDRFVLYRAVSLPQTG